MKGFSLQIDMGGTRTKIDYKNKAFPFETAVKVLGPIIRIINPPGLTFYEEEDDLLPKSCVILMGTDTGSVNYEASKIYRRALEAMNIDDRLDSHIYGKIIVLSGDNQFLGKWSSTVDFWKTKR